MIRWLSIVILVLLAPAMVRGETIFVEAESFTPSADGWQVRTNAETRKASRATTLHGANGAGNATASKAVTLKQAGLYRVWVRYLQVERWRGAFHLAALVNGKEIAGNDFDVESDPKVADWNYTWKFYEADLPAGEVTLKLSKYKDQNSTGYVRHVDCVLLTTDEALVPDHAPYGPQTYVRATLGKSYTKPVYIHIFADHFRDPWYGHHFLAKKGRGDGLAPAPADLLTAGEQTPWCNITPLIYQDSGVLLNISARHTYHEYATRLDAKLEFATAPDDKSIVKTIDADCTPSGMVVVMPPDLTMPENLARFGRDLDYANRTGKIADEFQWPKIGKVPEVFPFFVSSSVGGYGLPIDAAVRRREQKTLDYFGFSNTRKSHIGGAWHMKNGSYCQPDTDAIQKAALAAAKTFKESGKTVKDISFCMLMDEPTGQPDSFMATDAGYRDKFREWLKSAGKSPADLGVADWDAVLPVVQTDRDKHPELYYFTQRFRTRALADFMAVQRNALAEAYGGSFPTLVNFSDGAIYDANFCTQGVDYFELLSGTDQNAIWGEDWGNLSSTYQMCAYNVDLMRGAARRHGQTIGHYLIAYAGRKPWDIKLKCAGEAARGVKVFENFFYGTSWGTHEGGPTWGSSSWDNHPDKWFAIAETVREIGGAEDLLVPAMPIKSEVALLYSSASDIWTVHRNHAYGFDRMHTWLALAHAQVPMDIVGEKDAESGSLSDYKVCYLSGPNLTRAAAARLKDWVRAGGILWMTAAAATRDEFNRPLDILDEIRPGSAEPIKDNAWLYAGQFLHTMPTLATVQLGPTKIEAISVTETLSPKPQAQVIGQYTDGKAALVSSTAGKGTVYQSGFFPGLGYIKPALAARADLIKKQDAKTTLTADEQADVEVLERSNNPWKFPADVREALLTPIRTAKISPRVQCDVPLVDAVLMECDRGAVVPLSNYTLRPQPAVTLTIRTTKPVRRVESVQRGNIQFKSAGPQNITFTLPLESSEYVKLYY